MTKAVIGDVIRAGDIEGIVVKRDSKGYTIRVTEDNSGIGYYSNKLHELVHVAFKEIV